MENMDLLDLDNDILDIIGDYVKKDNSERIEKIFRMADRLFTALKKSRWNDNKPAMRHTIVNFFMFIV
jgi:hypothetical protein